MLLVELEACFGPRKALSEHQMRLELRLGAKRRAEPCECDRAFPLVRVAEDRGFEPLRAINPTRFPSERHRPLGESSAGEATRPDSHRRNRPPRLSANPPCGGNSLNPPGPEGSKGRWALPGAWGASAFLSGQALASRTRWRTSSRSSGAPWETRCSRDCGVLQICCSGHERLRLLRRAELEVDRDLVRVRGLPADAVGLDPVVGAEALELVEGLLPARVVADGVLDVHCGGHDDLSPLVAVY